MKKTKIICSIGPASTNPDIMEQMVLAGMNVARINFSHATLEEKQNVVASVHEVRRRTGKNIAILFDTKGPEFRNDEMENGAVTLVEGNEIKVVKGHIIGTDKSFSVNHPEAIDSINVGNTILLENGLMSLEVIKKDENELTCVIKKGGVFGSKKSLNVPGVHLSMPFVSDVDREDIIYACEHEGDFLAASFVSTADDVREIREIIKEHNSNMKIIAKIESETGIENLEEIADVADGIMVARGDLGVEAKMEILPYYQKKIIDTCRRHSKFAIVATEMLESMKHNVRPTRAEVSDVANAILDGTDAIMLSGETTTGDYPIEVVRNMANIASETEKYATFNRNIKFARPNNVAESIATSVARSADDLNAKLIIASTLSGYTARKIANLKPNTTILATCANEEVARSLALFQGVETAVIPVLETTDEIINKSIEVAKERFNLQTGDTVIVTGGFSNGKSDKKHTTNLMKIEKIA